MAHYFSKLPPSESKAFSIQYQFKNHSFTFVSDTGVFSKDHVDEATDLLLKNLQPPNTVHSALDLGCGYGVIGIVLNKVFNLSVSMSDVNIRAIDLAQRNLKVNKAQGQVVESDGFESLQETFDLIVTNPPIRVGKEKMYHLFEQSLQHLNDHGELWLVIHKKHGALSALKHLKTLCEGDIVNRTKGFHVIRCKKH